MKPRERAGQDSIARAAPAGHSAPMPMPSSRSHNVTLSRNATSVSGTPNSCEIGTMISRNIVKSNASKVQPSHDATQAYHWSFVGSFHHGIGPLAGPTAVLIVDASSLTAGVQPVPP